MSCCSLSLHRCKDNKAKLSHGEPRDAAVNFDTSNNFRTHHAVSAIARLSVGVSDSSNAEITHRFLIFKQGVTQNHGDSRKLRHTTQLVTDFVWGNYVETGVINGVWGNLVWGSC